MKPQLYHPAPGICPSERVQEAGLLGWCCLILNYPTPRHPGTQRLVDFARRKLNQAGWDLVRLPEPEGQGGRPWTS